MKRFTKQNLHNQVDTQKTDQISPHATQGGGKLIVLGLSLSLLSGCSYFQPYKAPLTQGNVMTQEAVSSLQIGLDKNQVRELLGPPLGKDPFNPNNWEYIFYSENTELHSDSAKHLVIHFDQDEMLESWAMRDKTIKLKQNNSFLGLGLF